MAFVRAIRALVTSAALSWPILLSRAALGLTASHGTAAPAVSPSLGSTPTTPPSSLEAYQGTDLLSSPWIRTDGSVAQSMLYSARWTRSGPAGSACTAKTGSPAAGMIASCTTGLYLLAHGLESCGVPLSATPLVCPTVSWPEEEEEEEQDGDKTAVLGGMLRTAPWTKNVEERTEFSATCQV